MSSLTTNDQTALREPPGGIAEEEQKTTVGSTKLFQNLKTKSAETFHCLHLCLSQVNTSTFPPLFAMFRNLLRNLFLFFLPRDH